MLSLGWISRSKGLLSRSLASATISSPRASTNELTLNLKLCGQIQPYASTSTARFSTSSSLAEVVRRGNVFIPTTHDVPADATSVSHILMIRAGLIRRDITKSSAGIYMLLPLAVRSLEKLTKIIDSEMQSIGGQKLHMPILLNSKMFKDTGRWTSTGKEMIKLKDRNNEDYCLGPTHEEIFTSLVAEQAKSFSPKSFPIKLYQIGLKYRDEQRPRSGLLRAREFLMKDMYSFDLDQEGALKTYKGVYDAYARIFKRIGLNAVAAEADSGNIGGNKSHEFHVFAEAGADTLLTCSKCEKTSNIELCARGAKVEEKVTIPNNFAESLINELKDKQEAEIAGVEGSKNVKLWVGNATYDSKAVKGINAYVLFITTSERELNPIKARKSVGAKEIEVEPLSSRLGKNLFDASAGAFYKIVFDQNFQFAETDSLLRKDIVNAATGDICSCENQGVFSAKRGIELGHVFYLGTKYSAPLGAFIKGEKGKTDLEMGCYGIGVTRILAAAIEASNDANGIVWPIPLAPYKAVVAPLITNDPELRELALEVYNKLNQSDRFRGDVLLDDRDKSAGFKLTEAELIGYPFVIVIGKHTKQTGEVEIKFRHNLSAQLKSPASEVVSLLSSLEDQYHASFK